MPIIASAKKKMRQDKKRETRNIKTIKTFKDALKKMRASQTPAMLQKAYAALDTAAKKHSIHPNKAARLKSRLARRVKGKK